MSTIVVVKKNNQCCIAADSMTSFGDLLLPASYDAHHDKIQTFGQTRLGIVGSAAHTLVIESAMKQTDLNPDFSSRLTIFETLVRLHKILKEDYFLTPKEIEEDPYESSHIDAVIATPSGIFGIFSLREVYEYNRFWAIGSGASYALGAMKSLYDEPHKSADDIAKAGVEAGTEFDSASALPMTFQTLTLKG
jgi:ATP-dependent protease HslVU (ClpYQ) peptidase subunit